MRLGDHRAEGAARRRRGPSRCRPACRPFWRTARVIGSSVSMALIFVASTVTIRLPSGSTRPGRRARSRSSQSSCSTIAGPAKRRADRQLLAPVHRRVVPAARRTRPARVVPARLGERRRRLPAAIRPRATPAVRRPITAVCRLTSTGADLGQLDVEALPVGGLEGVAQISRDRDRRSSDRHRQHVGLALRTACRRRAARRPPRRRRPRARAAPRPSSTWAGEDRVRLGQRRAPASGWLTVATKSWRRSATTQPSALVMPGPRRDQHASGCRARAPAPRRAAARRRRRRRARSRAGRGRAPATPCGSPRPSCRWRRARSPPPRRSASRPSGAPTLLDAALRGSRSSGPRARPRAARSGSSRPSSEVGVGDGRLRAAAAVADRTRRRARRSRARPCSMPEASTEAIEPPPAPIVWMSTIGTWIGIA